MLFLTRHEQLVVFALVTIFLLGLGVKQCRQVASQQSKLKDEVEGESKPEKLKAATDSSNHREALGT